MKCRSIACIWSDCPPAHKVTASAVLDRPETLYTGGSDGTIVWWNISPTDSNSGIRPIAMLCGHAASIADLDICFPATVPGDEKVSDSSNVDPNSYSVNYGALISASSDGVLCVWSRGSGHCRRRRKMPPWVGSPSMVRALPENGRYVCVACCFLDSVHVSERQSLEYAEGGDSLMNRELQFGKPSKCTIVIVDSYSLTIVQDVFHGNLSIGPLRFMSVILPVGDMEKQSVMLIDSSGKVEIVPLLTDSVPSGENLTSLQKISSSLENSDFVDRSNEGEMVVAFATIGQVLALVYRTYCLFRILDDGTTVGKISFLGSQFCIEGSGSQLHVTGAMFLKRNDARMKINLFESENMFVETFAVWNDRGFALLYTVSYSGSIFKFEPLSAIPAVSHPQDVRLSISFLHLNGYLLRTESLCFHKEDPLPWTPQVTMWFLPQQHGNNEHTYHECNMTGKGSISLSWPMNLVSSQRTKGIQRDVGFDPTGQENVTFEQNSDLLKQNADGILMNDEKYGHCQGKNLVSSSMVISEDFYAPYAIVYGFYNGEIEVLQFDTFFEGLVSHHGSPEHEPHSHASKQYLSGHTGAVLCLAAHRMLTTSTGWNFSHVLVSGSMDCTIRLWDLDSSSLIRVMHQHVAPVRQIILPPLRTDCPWRDCFLSVGEDSCVALASLETLRVERIFPGHPHCPAKVVWDNTRGYLACLCLCQSGASDSLDVLYIWDIKTGARERVLRGTSAHSMFDHFCSTINSNSLSINTTNANTSASSLQFPLAEDTHSSQSKNSGKGITSTNISPSTSKTAEPNTSHLHATKQDAANLYSSVVSADQSITHAIKSSCPFPGIATLTFDLASLMSLHHVPELFESKSNISGKSLIGDLEDASPKSGNKRGNITLKKQDDEQRSTYQMIAEDGSSLEGRTDTPENNSWDQSLEGCLLQFSLSFLHLWNVDCELDKLLITEMKLKRPESFVVGPGLLGDKGSLTLTFPSPSAALELWKSSSEFSAIRSVTMVSLAQHIVSLSHSCSTASSALAAFYTRNFAEKIPDMKPPLLQLLVSLWQDKSEHVRMAARSLFHCAATRGIPLPLSSGKAIDHAKLRGPENGTLESGNQFSSMEQTYTNSLISDGRHTEEVSKIEESEILAWMESFEGQDWISCVEGTSQDAMTSHIIVAAALAVWYPSLVKPNLAMLTVHPLMKLVMAMNEKFSATAAEILAEGMDNTWKPCIGSEIPRLISDIFFQIECVSSASTSSHNPTPSVDIRETLAGILLPSLAMADIPGFLNVVERQIWSTASDSPVHVVSLMVLLRIVRGSSRNLAQYLDKVLNYVLQTMDPGNSAMRKICLKSSKAALKEIVRVYPMVTLNDTSTRLAVGDAFADIKNASIRVYDMYSMTAIKVLDASGPPGLPSLLGGDSELSIATAISALSFSLDGEGLVAFSENGLMIRWWSLGSVWWEKLSRNLVPVQCTKLIFVPPWEGFSPNSTRSSIMANVLDNERQINSQENTRVLNEADRLKLLVQNLDLSYRLGWVGERKVLLTRHGHELGTFQL